MIARRKTAAPPVAAPAPPAPAAKAPAPPAAPSPDLVPPVPAAPKTYTSADDAIKAVSTDVLASMVKALVGGKEYANDKAAQFLIDALNGELKTRPVQVEDGELPKPAAPAPALPRAAAYNRRKSYWEKQIASWSAKNKTSSKKMADLESFLDKHRMYHWEGSSGLRQLEQLISMIGYGSLEEFLEDNPGGQQAIVEWIGSANVPDWEAVFGGNEEEEEGGSYDDEGSHPEMGGRSRFSSKRKASWTSQNEKTMEVESGGDRVPEVAEAHGKLEDHTGIVKTKVILPEKFAAEIATSTAVKKADGLADTLKKTYLDAKVLTTVNDSRPVRDAVESIYHASVRMGEAVKTLAKQQEQEDADEAAAQKKLKDSKTSAVFNLGGLVIADYEGDNPYAMEDSLDMMPVIGSDMSVQ